MTPFQIIISLMMVATGSVNTIVTKMADLFCSNGVTLSEPEWHVYNVSSAKNQTSSPGVDYCRNATYIQDMKTVEEQNAALYSFRQFDHPFVQSFTMFVGEFSCLIVFKLIIFSSTRNGGKSPFEMGEQKFNPLIWLIPAICDSCATTAMYIGLTMTYASSFQMLRGSVVIFTGLLSVVWLGKKLKAYNWAGMFLVLGGLILVGLSGFLDKSAASASASNPLVGDLIIVIAQVVVAFQMVVEEKLMTKYKVPPMQAVGWEGFFGMIIMISISAILSATTEVGDPITENMKDAFIQLDPSKPNKSGGGLPIFLLFCGTICSIALFNFSGLSVTREMGAVYRMVLDSIRTIIIWGFGVLMSTPYDQNQKLQPIDAYTGYQVAGFVVLLFGTFVYNDKETGEVYPDTGKPITESLAAPLFRLFGFMKREKGISADDYSERTPLLGKSNKSVNP
eukprot:m.412002 g.412002  ORF g.412002 m.412002 type:complete len:450 (+) comp28772_c0_seq1:73-1422(+)